MFPTIFQYKFITIGSYGLMLGIGFFLSFFLLEREFKLRNMNPEFAYKILFVAVIGGIIGSRLFDILDHIDQFIELLFDLLKDRLIAPGHQGNSRGERIGRLSNTKTFDVEVTAAKKPGDA